mgnify:CR=1 FL=1
MTSVLFIVLNWNGKKDTLKCLGSLRGQSISHSVVVVDNNSRDGSIEAISKQFPDVLILAQKKNRGFAGGVNVGIRYAIKNGFDKVALFNNDAIADPKWLESLVAGMKKSRASIVTGLLLDARGETIDDTGEFYSTWGVSFARNRNEPVEAAPKAGFVFGATGGASLYKTSLFKEIGLFDESFFAYYEDIDLSFRAQLAGHKVYYTDKAVACHERGSTSKKISGFGVYQTFKNLPLLYTKNVPVGLLFPIGIRLLLLYVLIFGNAVKNGDGVHALKGWLASVGYFWTRAIWLRPIIQLRRKVSSDDIYSILYRDLPPEQTGMRKLRKFFTGKD